MEFSLTSLLLNSMKLDFAFYSWSVDPSVFLVFRPLSSYRNLSSTLAAIIGTV